MSNNANYIKNILSLRNPQAESLDILENIVKKLSLSKNVDINEELNKIHSKYPICTDFERTFPSVCFSLATGVGKTRLMGAFIAYLYKEKGIKNFMVLAPNLTIYNKLINDFTFGSNKYVLNGISDFSNSIDINIITGENYKNNINTQTNMSKININIFNIDKINAGTNKNDKTPQIKKLSEFIGESYFQYLSRLEDLVMLMDESHHYRAVAGMKVLNELNPVLGLELTATPQTIDGSKVYKFKNVVYEYSLAKAITDGFVKTPAVLTKKNFDPGRYSQEDIDFLKLTDGIRIHEDTKVELDIYARNNKVKRVKPFVLVVTKSIEHANTIKERITDNSFFNGYYKDKVIVVHSKQSGQEKIENIEQLLSVEDENNNIEIVIHIDKLKEGWDVKNLYTIIPLRASASATLTEQTIGRGLRLPYGKITGDDKIDRLTIISHDKYSEIIKLANEENSIIRKQNIIELEDTDLEVKKEVITNKSSIEQEIEYKKSEIFKDVNWQDNFESKKEIATLDITRNIVDVISIMPKENINIKQFTDLSKEEIKEQVIERAINNYEKDGQFLINEYKEEIKEEMTNRYEDIIKKIEKNIIEIPKIVLVQKGEILSRFNEFDLDVSNLNYQPLSEELLITTLQNNKTITIQTKKGKYQYDSLENMMVSEIINYSEVDYDTSSELIYKLVNQAINKLKSYLNDKEITNVVFNFKHEIGKYIYSQMMEHFEIMPSEYEEPKIYPFEEIYNHNYSKYVDENILDYKTTVKASEVRHKVFTGFLKSYHDLYKFDSTPEKDFCTILENDIKVLKWLRPTEKQFDIWYNNNSKKYEPDFIVETENDIFMIEVKADNEIDDTDVLSKKDSSLIYCEYASMLTKTTTGKVWRYLLIPSSSITFGKDFEYFVKYMCK